MREKIQVLIADGSRPAPNTHRPRSPTARALGWRRPLRRQAPHPRPLRPSHRSASAPGRRFVTLFEFGRLLLGRLLRLRAVEQVHVEIRTSVAHAAHPGKQGRRALGHHDLVQVLLALRDRRAPPAGAAELAPTSAAAVTLPSRFLSVSERGCEPSAFNMVEGTATAVTSTPRTVAVTVTGVALSGTGASGSKVRPTLSERR